MTTLAEAAADAAARLARVGVVNPEVDARWLVEAAAGRDPRRAPDAELTGAEAERLAGLVARRSTREPLQLVLGTTAFRTLELACLAGVFVPRPETEVLAGLAIVESRAAVAAHGSALVIEPCCGTGAVALSIATEVAEAHVHAADVNPDAVRLARSNLAALRSTVGPVSNGSIGERVHLGEGDLLDAFDVGLRGRVDVLVANPPYLPMSDLADLPPEVAAHDPHAALFGGTDGHEVVDALLAAAPDWLAPGGTVLLELDVRRGTVALEVASAVGLVDARLERDLGGALRFLVARRDARPAQARR